MAGMSWKNIAVEDEPMKTACAFEVLVLSLACWGIAVHAEDTFAQGATAAAETWLGQVDAGDYAGSWREASAYVQGAITEQAWVASLTRVRTPLGQQLSRQLTQV
jgi:hypothetical protein